MSLNEKLRKIRTDTSKGETILLFIGSLFYAIILLGIVLNPKGIIGYSVNLSAGAITTIVYFGFLSMLGKR